MRYDTVQDARAKLQGTLAYYGDTSVYIHEITEYLPDPNANVLGMRCRLNWLTDMTAKRQTVDITDLKFRYMEFNIGYINAYQYATWFFRMPFRQYRQGLRNDQCQFRDESGLWRNINVNQAHILGATAETGFMMEDKYPSFEEALKGVRDKTAIKIAFHRDFAISQDGLRGEIVLEHKGIPTAYADTGMIFKCNSELNFLRETISELKLKVA